MMSAHHCWHGTTAAAGCFDICTFQQTGNCPPAQVGCLHAALLLFLNLWFCFCAAAGVTPAGGGRLVGCAAGWGAVARHRCRPD